MAKVRVYELAKEFGVESKDVMTALKEMGEFVSSAWSTIEAPTVRKLKEKFTAGEAQPDVSRNHGMPSHAGYATIVISRKISYRDLVGSYVIMVDSKPISKIRVGQRVELAVPPGRHELFLKVYWGTSPSITFDVQPGAVIEFSCKPTGFVSAMKGVLGETGKYITLTMQQTTRTTPVGRHPDVLNAEISELVRPVGPDNPAHVRACDPNLSEKERILARGQCANSDEGWRLYQAQLKAQSDRVVEAELERLKAEVASDPRPASTDRLAGQKLSSRYAGSGQTRVAQAPGQEEYVPDPADVVEVQTCWEEAISHVPDNDKAYSVRFLAQRTGMNRSAIFQLRDVRNMCAHARAKKGVWPSRNEFDMALVTARELLRRLLSSQSRRRPLVEL